MKQRWGWLAVGLCLLFGLGPGCQSEEPTFLAQADFDKKYGRDPGEPPAAPSRPLPEPLAADGGKMAAGGAGHGPQLIDSGARTPPDAGAPPVGCPPGFTQCDGACVAGECLVPVEDCTNGLDDNGDGLGDCADPVCSAGYRCVPPPPPGFSPVFALATTGPGTNPSCAGSYTELPIAGLHQIPSAEAAACDCQCSASGATCRVQLDFYEGSACSGVPWTLTGAQRLESGVCDDVLLDKQGTPGSESVRALMQPPAKTTGTCTATPLPLPSVEWGVSAQGCAPPVSNALGCDLGSCIPNPPEELGPLCVSQVGDVDCPASFPRKQVFYRDVEDTRACQCGCSVTCATHVTAYTGDACMPDPGTTATLVVADDSCVPLPLDPSPSGPGALDDETRSFRTPAATCPAELQTTGGVSPTGAVTVCCE
ncbi:MAG: hypothetical protein RJA70_794 [Pseudomonadota bacterium]|jgi:hypothetical protein